MLIAFWTCKGKHVLPATHQSYACHKSFLLGVMYFTCNTVMLCWHESFLPTVLHVTCIAAILCWSQAWLSRGGLCQLQRSTHNANFFLCCLCLKHTNWKMALEINHFYIIVNGYQTVLIQNRKTVTWNSYYPKLKEYFEPQMNFKRSE